MAAPPRNGFDHAKDNQAEPEINHQPKIYAKWNMMRGRGHITHQQEIQRISS